MIDIGKQYTTEDNRVDASGFKAKARQHQSEFRAKTLRLPHDNYGNYLTKKDGENGMNFYQDFGIFEAVKNYRPYNRPLYSNMLRSEHIPFNFFIPLRHDLTFCTNVFNEILGGCIKSIDKYTIIEDKINIIIEFAPKPKEYYLNDRTSFDAYIEYNHTDNSKGIIGIEAKYTEREYKISGKTEQEAIDKPNSNYYIVSAKSGLFKQDSYKDLKSDNFRQIWRNQILGESILQHKPDSFKHFSSLTFFPKGNMHFIDASKEYSKLLLSNNNNFMTVLYEDYFSILRSYTHDKRFSNWIDYLQDRYIVK
jgi:hypothetical protein